MLSKNHSVGCCVTTHGQAPVQFARHCWSSVFSWTQCCLQVLYFPILYINGLQYLTVDTFFPQEPRGTCLPMIIPFQLATLVFSNRPIDLGMKQQVFPGMVEKSHSVVDGCTKSAVTNDNAHDVTYCFLPKQRPLSNHFRTVFIHLQMLTDSAYTS